MTAMELVGLNTKWYRYKKSNMQIRLNLKWLISVL